mgnify:CR=1 FL=1
MTKVYSLTQRWAPVATQEVGQEEVRVHLLALFEENSGECLAKEMTEVALQPLELASWALEKLPSALPKETQILLDDPNLLGPLAVYLRDFEVVLAPRAEYRDQFFAGLLEQLQYFQNAADYCLLESFGEADTLRFFKTAREYLQAAPWRLFGRQTFLEFRDAEAKEQVVGVYCLEADELIGFCFLDAKEYRACREQGSLPDPIWGLEYGNVAYVGGADLDLLDRKGLAFPPDQYPWILVQSLPDGLTRGLFEELLWLLQRIPQIARSGETIQADGRRLGLAPS